MQMMRTVSQRVIWFIFLRPLSPSIWSLRKYGTKTPSSWMTMDAEMYGITPSAKIEALPKAPPENMSRRPTRPSLDESRRPASMDASMPGSTTKQPKR